MEPCGLGLPAILTVKNLQIFLPTNGFLCALTLDSNTLFLLTAPRQPETRNPKPFLDLPPGVLQLGPRLAPTRMCLISFR